MKVKAVKKFRDLKEKKVRQKGEIFEVTKKRFEEINSTSFGVLVEEVKEAKSPPPKPKPAPMKKG